MTKIAPSQSRFMKSIPAVTSIMSGSVIRFDYQSDYPYCSQYVSYDRENLLSETAPDLQARTRQESGGRFGEALL